MQEKTITFNYLLEDGHTFACLLRHLARKSLACGRVISFKIQYEDGSQYKSEEQLLDIGILAVNLQRISFSDDSFKSGPLYSRITIAPDNTVISGDVKSSELRPLNPDEKILDYKGSKTLILELQIDFQEEDLVRKNYLEQDNEGYYLIDAVFSDLIDIDTKVNYQAYQEIKNTIICQMFLNREIDLQKAFVDRIQSMYDVLSQEIKITEIS